MIGWFKRRLRARRSRAVVRSVERYAAMRRLMAELRPVPPAVPMCTADLYALEAAGLIRCSARSL